jgi:hypothetical protein
MKPDSRTWRVGDMVRVPNNPPYQHPSASEDYWACVVRPREARPGAPPLIDSRPRRLLFTQAEISRARERADANPEDTLEPRRGLIARLFRLLFG